MAAVAANNPVVQEAGGQSHSGERPNHLDVCCVSVESGADIRTIAQDLRSLKAGVTILTFECPGISQQLGPLLIQESLYEQSNGSSLCREGQFIRVDGKNCCGQQAMFCGSTQAVALVDLKSTLVTPGEGLIQIIQYDFKAQYADSTMLRVGLLQVPSSHWNSSAVAESWEKVASELLRW